MHRLVQLVTRDHLSDDQRALWAKEAVQMVSAAYSECWRRYAHMGGMRASAAARASAATHAEALQVAPDATASVLRRAGVYLYRRMELSEARRCLERALSIHEKAFGPGHPELARIVTELGAVLVALGDLAEHDRCCERAVWISDRLGTRRKPLFNSATWAVC